MTESEFLRLAEQLLERIESAVEAADADIEIEHSGNVLTLELDDGSEVVINSQAPMQQIWVAARSGAHHFAWRDGDWFDTREGGELFAVLSRLLSRATGQAIVLGRG